MLNLFVIFSCCKEKRIICQLEVAFSNLPVTVMTLVLKTSDWNANTTDNKMVEEETDETDHDDDLLAVR